LTGIVDAGIVDAVSPADDASTSTPVEAGPCTPVSLGPRYATDAVAGAEWTTPNGALEPGDNLVAQSKDSIAAIGVRAFGFAVPPGAQILGITVEIGRNADPTLGGALSDEAVSLPQGTPKANGTWPDGTPTGPFPNSTYGSPQDTWGATWTASEINAPSFGVSLKPAGKGFGNVDSIGVTIAYCAASSAGH
jgi:hypothetical protein